MALLGSSSGNDGFIRSAEKNILYNLKFQQPNGWFANNCLYDPDMPLLHTICYALRGVLETGLLLNNEGFIAAAKTAADNLLVVVEENAFPPGRLDKHWKGTVGWSCLTGNAQLAIILLRLHQRTSDARYAPAAQKLINFIKTTQNCVDSDPGIRGGIKGSYSFNGGYGTFQMLNWAAKSRGRAASTWQSSGTWVQSPRLMKRLSSSRTTSADNAVGGLRLARFAKHLPKFGWAVSVLTVRDAHREASDAARLKDIEGVEIFKTAKTAGLRDIYLKLKATLSGALSGKKISVAELKDNYALRPSANESCAKREGFGGTLKKVFISLILLPDEHRNWVLPTAFKAIKLLRQRR